MVLVFIVCIIFIVFLALILSTIRIKIKNLKISGDTKKYEVNLSWYLFNKIKWASINLDEKKMSKMYKKINLEKYNISKVRDLINIRDLKDLTKPNIKVTKFNLNASIGTENVLVTSFLVVIFSTLISMLLTHVAENKNKDDFYYNIVPVYEDKNIYEVEFYCIIEVKMVHIINILVKKRRVGINERSSNRRAYGYSHE